ncbi:MAG: D-glycero-beta-D-manno-heptose 1-phosphate adenylyltransferase [Candidatus Omnitrophota bacterium]|nr:D-glycero-beta-D-manno-heptose 1-phosphate adenylyltransferase [Candidatus Omnitrophota bacterium]
MLESKIKHLSELRKVLLRLKTANKKIVFTNGCFDLLHYGHVKYLEDAKRKGDILVVAVNSDTSVKKIKSDIRPVISEKDRMRIIASLESVDYVVLFRDKTPLKVIKLLNPDILIKGADWHNGNIVGADFVTSYGGKVLTIKLVKGRSTTSLIKKIAKKFAR